MNLTAVEHPMDFRFDIDGVRAVSDMVSSNSDGAFRRSRPPFQRLRQGLPVCARI
jgi:hypothetical protein